MTDSVFNPMTVANYKDHDAMVAIESNGFVVVLTSARPATLPVVFGPFTDKVEATNARARIRNRLVQVERPYKVSSMIRPCWKDPT